MREGLTKEELGREEWREYGRLFLLAFPEKSRASSKKWRLKNKEHRSEYERQRHLKDPTRTTRQRAKNPERYRAIGHRFRAKHRERLQKEARERRKTDHNWHIKCVLRCRMYQAMRNEWKTGSAIELLGCSIPDFRIYLESKFESGMTWENFGKGKDKWNIDHIMPCAIFDLTDPEHQKRCFHFSNLQPLWATQNMAKGARVCS